MSSSPHLQGTGYRGLSGQQRRRRGARCAAAVSRWAGARRVRRRRQRCCAPWWQRAQARAAQVGAAIYALRVPERWWPGAFDLAFHSHQLFHLCVVGAAAVHYRGVRVLLAWRDASGVCL